MAERGMGRGLAAILQVSGQDGDRPELRDISIELIEPNPNQPRRRFDEDALQALAGSLAEQGVLQPILVRPLPGARYELVAGERRWRAAQLAGLELLPAIVERRDDAASLEAAIVENMAREDLNPVEEARAVAALVEELGLTREAVGNACRPQPRRRVEPAPDPRPPGRCAPAPRAWGAERGSWPRAAAGRGSRRPPIACSRGGRGRLVGPGSRGSRAPRQRGRAGFRPRGEGPASGPGGGLRDARRAARRDAGPRGSGSAARHRLQGRVRRRGPGRRRAPRPPTRDAEGGLRAAVRGRRRARPPRYTCPPARAISSVG